jgi:hypothetical protein
LRDGKVKKSGTYLKKTSKYVPENIDCGKAAVMI